ncbi:hypothetical protein BH18CHL2_BH18CHL2_10000 [soil metagenome]
MPPALVALGLVAVAVPAALRAAAGRPRGLLTAWVACAAAVAVAQAVGELAGSRIGLLGDAQLLLAALGAALASAGVALAETRRRGRTKR